MSSSTAVITPGLFLKMAFQTAAAVFFEVGVVFSLKNALVAWPQTLVVICLGVLATKEEAAAAAHGWAR